MSNGAAGGVFDQIIKSVKKFLAGDIMRARWLFLMFLVTDTMFGAKILTGDATTSDATFTFSIGTQSFYSSSSIMVGAGEMVANNTYAVSSYMSTASRFIPLAVSTAKVNNVANQSNPLTGQKIKAVDIHGGNLGAPVHTVVINKEQISTPVPASERLYTITEASLKNTNKPEETTVSLIYSDVPHDANGDACGYIVGIRGGYTFSGSTYADKIFCAVTQNGSDFGIGNSGIAVAAYTVTGDTEKTYALTFFDAQTGVVGNRAVAFNTDTSAIKVGDAIDSFETDVLPVVDMYWNAYMSRLYIAVRVKAADGATNGARALVVGRVEDNKLVLTPFVPDAVVLDSANNSIVGASDGEAVSLYKVRGMHTSTGLDYLIVNGGNNESGTTGIRSVANQVYAIPLVNENTIGSSSWKTSDTHGTAAATNQQPTTTCNSETERFIMRRFTTPATAAAQMVTTSDLAAKVGAGVLPIIPTSAPTDPMVIKDLFVVGDSVYVCIAASYAEAGGLIQEPGIFHSRAIFDQYGAIAAWTPWERVNGSDNFAYAATMDQYGNFWFLTGSADDQVKIVKKTLWGFGELDGLLGGTTTSSSVGLVSVLGQQFPTDEGGIQAISSFDAHESSAEIPHSGLDGKTIMLACGRYKLAFVLTGDDSQATGTIQPYTGDFSTGLATGTNGNFPSGSGRVYMMTGGDLGQIGLLTTQTIFSNDTHSWIAVGGTNGLAILSDATGQGFAPDGGLPTGFTFKKIKGFGTVQKIMGDGTYLYILTSTKLDRITIDPTAFASGTVTHTTVASIDAVGSNKYSCFYDMVIADKLALLATSNGLFRVSNGFSIKNSVPAWTQVLLGESIGPVLQLSAISSDTDYQTGLANHGQVFALSAFAGFDTAQLYRLYIHEGTTISDTSVQNIGDIFKKDIPSYFISFGHFMTGYADDGTVRLSVRPVNDPLALSLSVLPFSLGVGQNAFSAKNSTSVITGVNSKGLINQPQRMSSSGAWLVPGNFGLQVNE